MTSRLKKYLTLAITTVFFASVLLLPASPIFSHTALAQVSGQSGTISANSVTGKATAALPPGGDLKISPTSCFTNPPGCASFYLAATVNSFLALFVSLGALAAGFVMDLSQNVALMPIVQIGFSIALSLANLGFVLGIIVIAIATILRIENYGVKQLLWKLIVMAIAVNFSMVIAGSILTFTNSLTDYFMKSAVPTSGNLGTTAQFATTITAAFGANNLFIPPDGSKVGENSSIFNKYILLQGLSGVFMMLIAFVFFALTAMFMIRFLFMTFLLILMPLAWLMWVFPVLHSNWEKWWHQFLRWAFFAPVSVFFLYLTIATAQNIGGNGTSTTDLQGILDKHSATISSNLVGTLGTQSSAADGVAAMTASAQGFIGSIVKIIVLFGLAMGGLFAANAFGIQGASTAINLAKSTPGFVARQGGRAAGWAGRKGFEEVSRSAGFSDIASNLVARAGQIKNPVLRVAAGYGAKAATRIAVEGREKVIQREEKAIADMSSAELKAELNVATGAGRVAILKKLAAKDSLKGIDMNLIHGEDTRKLFSDYNQDHEYEDDIEKKIGISYEMFQNRKDEAKLRDATEKFVRTLTKADISKLKLNDLFGKDGGYGMTGSELSEISTVFAKTLAAERAQLVPVMIPKFKTEPGNKFDSIYRAELDELKRKAADTEKPRWEKLIKAYEETIAKNLTNPGNPDNAGGAAAHA